MNWKMREIVLAVVLSIACGVLYLGWSTLWLPISALVGPVGAEFMFGVWVVASPLVAFIVRKPGAALIAEVAAAAVEVFTGSHFGLSSLLIGILQGLGAEIAFFMFRYKKYSVPVLMLSGVLAAIGSMVYSLLANGFAYYTTGVLLATFGLRVISGAILGGLLAKIIAESLAKTGILSSYEMMKQRRHHGGDPYDSASGV
ncbi:MULTISPECIES: ECF transporter S component [Aneurinibacillus]|uniref:ECF transporter S component n=1 Tax=Aneurinibacillus thermoaerophilus TaxID=143495 RepID=A0A1G7XZ46_ANETH|nr:MULTISPECIES: ECF transporter S component [Aneurinibacillus]AMA73017.1 ABC transporter ATP-binding protein [Aneurinibacillus sp. XH2]MED0675969.1 ECF transporter S component [Aneurinibacillus thermoaerophilus]MED0677755.1 ECF transporter S component [Aneurinibacillus thermoaerophilus]MED0737505.1 ECF transporter S component [Aneurinibacillus thermoaerophilus]MED0758076.1 ECF transporter S component [Aneurinibacillus thermoaerophilus]